jgi:FKBP-type peptidyl-prolyl cis-trans isomerase FkpA
MLKNIALIGLISISLSGCLKGSTANDMCNYDPCAVKASLNEQEAIETYLGNNNIDAEKHCSGLYYTIETPGTGKTAGVCSNITVNYTGKLTNGSQFDASSSGPVTFLLRDVIAGWKNGIPLVKEGGHIRLFVPPSLGYGNQDYKDRYGNVVIPGGSILIFDVELKQVQ